MGLLPPDPAAGGGCIQRATCGDAHDGPTSRHAQPPRLPPSLPCAALPPSLSSLPSSQAFFLAFLLPRPAWRGAQHDDCRSLRRSRRFTANLTGPAQHGIAAHRLVSEGQPMSMYGAGQGAVLAQTETFNSILCLRCRWICSIIALATATTVAHSEPPSSIAGSGQRRLR